MADEEGVPETPEAPEPSGPPIVVLSADVMIQQRCEEVARKIESILLPLREPAQIAGIPYARIFVIDIRMPGAIEVIASTKQRLPDVPVAAVMSVPDQNLWRQAESAGADLVSTRGTLHRQLPRLLESFTGRTPAKRISIGPMREFEGRLGFLWLIESGTQGAPEDIAVFRVGYEFHAVTNACPHAGAPLKDGELAGTTLTCPMHGSQFDVSSGERTRGPSDVGLTHYPVVVEDGSVYVVVDR